ncbi:hypothetical protein NT05HA_0290 [Aggregatibacter aphrophilus NJ8700]|nr:hypothetical protein NT05HA_0290 [Aggregatibacter aphrophilus NJ8700]
MVIIIIFFKKQQLTSKSIYITNNLISNSIIININISIKEFITI